MTARGAISQLWSSAASTGAQSVGGVECGDGQDSHRFGYPTIRARCTVAQLQLIPYT